MSITERLCFPIQSRGLDIGYGYFGDPWPDLAPHLWGRIPATATRWRNLWWNPCWMMNYWNQPNLSFSPNHQHRFCLSSLSSICFQWRFLMEPDLCPCNWVEPISSPYQHIYYIISKKKAAPHPIFFGTLPLLHFLLLFFHLKDCLNPPSIFLMRLC